VLSPEQVKFSIKEKGVGEICAVLNVRMGASFTMAENVAIDISIPAVFTVFSPFEQEIDLPL
jgi:hypothetical protein